MTDPRVTPFNGRVAHVSLMGEVEAEEFTEGTWMMVQQPIANIVTEPGGPRASQLIFGEQFLVLETRDGFSFGQAQRDGQVGWIMANALTKVEDPTHWVVAPATHLYPKPMLKASPDVALFFGSQVYVTKEREDFLRIHTGHFVPRQHLMTLSARFSDPVGVADLFVGTPYLWGGSSRWGLDCSGLVQLALIACGIDCPRDSDQQQEVLGEEIGPDETLQRNDLIFWEGHVGFMSGPKLLLHANAHYMSVGYEPLKDVAARIAAEGGGPITARRRLPLG